MKSVKGNMSVQPTVNKNPDRGKLTPLPAPPQANKVKSLKGSK